MSDESLLVDGERVRGVEVREAMLGWWDADSLVGPQVDVGLGVGADADADDVRVAGSG